MTYAVGPILPVLMDSFLRFYEVGTMFDDSGAYLNADVTTSNNSPTWAVFPMLPFPVKGNEHTMVVIHGRNYTFYGDTADIYVIGHSGLARNGWDSNSDGYYVSKHDK